MVDLMAKGSAWLDQQRHRFLTRPVTYQRGASTVALQATVGRTVFRFDDHAGNVTRYVSRDFLVRASDLVLDGYPATPKRGDRIREPHGQRVMIHEVMAPGRDEPDWRYSDPDRQTLRIHTKQTGVEST